MTCRLGAGGPGELMLEVTPKGLRTRRSDVGGQEEMDVPAQVEGTFTFSAGLFCSDLKGLAELPPHTHNGKGHLLIQMPISSQNPLTDTPEIASHQLSGSPLSPAKWTYNVNHHTLHGGGKPALQSIPSAETENSTSQAVPPTQAFMLTALCLNRYPSVQVCTFLRFGYRPTHPCFTLLLQTHHLLLKCMFMVSLLTLEGTFKEGEGFIHGCHLGHITTVTRRC